MFPTLREVKNNKVVRKIIGSTVCERQTNKQSALRSGGNSELFPCFPYQCLTGFILWTLIALHRIALSCLLLTAVLIA